MNKQLLIGLSLFGAAALTPNTKAVSFRLPNQDPEAIARGNAFAATADNPSAIYYNPAGITQINGHEISAGLYLVSSGTEFTQTGTGLKAKTDSEFQPVPQIYFVCSPKDSKLSYGLGIYAPYGLSVDWGDTPPFGLLAQEGSVLYASINPVIAYEISPTLSIAAGPTFNYSQAEIEFGLVPGGKFRFAGDGFDTSFNAGILWKPHEKWSFGLNYRYQSDIEYKGHSQDLIFGSATRKETKGELHYPQFVVAGVSYRPTEDWNIEVNVDWTDWDSVNTVTFQNTYAASAGNPNGDIPFVLNHTSSFMYEIGATRKLANNYWVAAGFFYSENSVPDKSYSAFIPDSDLYLGSIGFGNKGEHFRWAIAYHFGWNGDGGRVVSGSQTPIGPVFDGRYETLNHGFNISAAYKF